MTCREKLKLEHPEAVSDLLWGGCMGCPSSYDYLDNMDDLWELYEDGRITANDFRAKMNLPMVKNAEKFMKRRKEE